ncbi:MAG TPA: biotin/lipoyl-binding protein [Candidatus Syntrophosphaera sp.]|jgi:biotin carboxyl carrier protein|nr:biotin/lipoyl-binding protein [Candidatus Syntrophosphaera sp.]
MKTYKLIIGGQRYEARVLEYTPSHAKININGTDYLIQIEDDALPQVPVLPQQEQAVPLAPAFSSDFASGTGEIRAPLPGVIASLKVKEGEAVKKGQTILVLEAMKMESELAAPVDCVVEKIHVKDRAPVQEGDLLMTLTGIEIKEKPAAKPARPQNLPPAKTAPADRIVRAPLPGNIIEVKVQPGEFVREDQTLLILEAMKMESEIHSNLSGKVLKVHVQKGDNVQEGDPLIELEA